MHTRSGFKFDDVGPISLRWAFWSCWCFNTKEIGSGWLMYVTILTFVYWSPTSCTKPFLHLYRPPRPPCEFLLCFWTKEMYCYSVKWCDWFALSPERMIVAWNQIERSFGREPHVSAKKLCQWYTWPKKNLAGSYSLIYFSQHGRHTLLYSCSAWDNWCA